MAECELIQGCIFFNNKMQNMPATADILKGKFCKDAYATCARYMVFKALGRAKVPADLYRNKLRKRIKSLARDRILPRRGRPEIFPLNFPPAADACMQTETDSHYQSTTVPCDVKKGTKSN